MPLMLLYVRNLSHYSYVGCCRGPWLVRHVLQHHGSHGGYTSVGLCIAVTNRFSGVSCALFIYLELRGLRPASWLAGKGFEANLEDPRFKSLFTSADFALDPTDPRFQQADGSNNIAKAVAQQRQQKAAIAPADNSQAGIASMQNLKPQAQAEATAATPPGVSDAAQLTSMIASLKRKSTKAKKGQAASVKPEAPAKKKKKQRVA